MSNGDTPGGGGGSAPQPNNDFFPTPISPSPVTEGNAPAPGAPPPQGASPMSMQPFPLDIGPPRDENHFNERKAGWKRVFEQFQSNPALSQALLSFGTIAMQPAAMRGRGAQVGQLGQALGGAAETYGMARQQQVAQAEQQRKAALEERRVGAEEERVKIEKEKSQADVKRINQESEKLALEIKSMPEDQRLKHELTMRQIDEAIAKKDYDTAGLKLRELQYAIKSDPRLRDLELRKLEAEIARDRAQALQSAATPQERQIESMVRGGRERREAEDLVYGRSGTISREELRDAGAIEADSLKQEWERTKPKDTKGKAQSFEDYARDKLSDPFGEYGGPQNSKLRAEIKRNLAPKKTKYGTTVEQEAQDIRKSLRAGKITREQAVQALQDIGYEQDR